MASLPTQFSRKFSLPTDGEFNSKLKSSAVSAATAIAMSIENTKAAQSVEVSQLIIDEGLVHTSLVLKEVDWFFNRMGIDDAYFLTTPAKNIAKHISCLYAGKILALSSSDKSEHDFRLKQEEDKQAFYTVRSQPGSLLDGVVDLERMIDARYLIEGYYGTASPDAVPQAYRIKVFRSSGAISDDIDVQLRFYLLHCPKFRVDVPDDCMETKLDLISDQRMLKVVSIGTQQIYQELISEVVGHMWYATRIEKTQIQGQRRLVLAYHHGTVHSLFSALTHCYHQRDMFCPKKFVEQFRNGVTIISIYLEPLPQTLSDNEIAEQAIETRVALLCRDIAFIYVLARTALTPLFSDGILTAEEGTYSYVAWKYAHQFLSRYRREYSALLASVEKNEPGLMGHLLRLKQNLRKDTFTEQRVLDALKSYPALLKALYADFANRHGPTARTTKQHHLNVDELPNMSELEALIQHKCNSELDATIFYALSMFNRHVLKTNFYKQKKIALSFRLHPNFLSKDEYPSMPHAVFFIVGSTFRGFHIRFDDVSRGGIRIISSRNSQTYAHNVGAVFDENYNLASTQQRKNKDIPEGGSKGTIFLSQNHQDKAQTAFRQYVDALLDLLLPCDEVVDYLCESEILFLGPDEGTADYMDWASQHARARGAHFWKAFTTGKSASIGGIPHDTFGMTTRSVHQYVLGVLNKIGLDETECTKFQTGGPDGDLGSNEVLISHDRTVAVVDGSGVLYDPAGINRQELCRLAKNRSMCKAFDQSKLGPEGFYISTEEREVLLPDGKTVVSSGLMYRNNFHLNPLASADLFVPCGGRPEAINLNNIDELLDDNGKCRFKVIIEGANLFISQQARLRLEQVGVIIYKDASANKGGVTSSSLEVLAALALNDAEFHEHMMVIDGKMPPFYRQYVAEVQNIIEENARLEFECIWREHASSGTARCTLTDAISVKINSLNKSLRNSSLWNNLPLRRQVVSSACPPCLIALIGIDTLLSRVPLNYLQAIFGAKLASMYMYDHGVAAPQFAFFEFMQNIVCQAENKEIEQN